MEPIRNEWVYMMTGDQLKQFADYMLDTYIERQKENDPIFLKKTCSKSAAARHLKKTRVTVYHMINDGRLKASSDGKVIVSSIRDYENGCIIDKNGIKINKRGNRVYV